MWIWHYVAFVSTPFLFETSPTSGHNIRVNMSWFRFMFFYIFIFYFLFFVFANMGAWYERKSGGIEFVNIYALPPTHTHTHAHTRIHAHAHAHAHAHTHTHTHTHPQTHTQFLSLLWLSIRHAHAHINTHTLSIWHTHVGWLRLAGSLKLYVSFAKEPYKRD